MFPRPPFLSLYESLSLSLSHHSPDISTGSPSSQYLFFFLPISFTCRRLIFPDPYSCLQDILSSPWAIVSPWDPFRGSLQDLSILPRLTSALPGAQLSHHLLKPRRISRFPKFISTVTRNGFRYFKISLLSAHHFGAKCSVCLKEMQTI